MASSSLVFVSVQAVRIRLAAALLRLLPGFVDAVVFLLRLLTPSVVQLVSVGVDLLHPVPDLLHLPLRLFFFSVLHFFLSSSTPTS